MLMVLSCNVTVANVSITVDAVMWMQFAVAFGTCPVMAMMMGAVAEMRVDAVPWTRGLIPHADASAAERPSAAMLAALKVPCIVISKLPGVVSVLAVTWPQVSSCNVETAVRVGNWMVTVVPPWQMHLPPPGVGIMHEFVTFCCVRSMFI